MKLPSPPKWSEPNRKHILAYPALRQFTELCVHHWQCAVYVLPPISTRTLNLSTCKSRLFHQTNTTLFFIFIVFFFFFNGGACGWLNEAKNTLRSYWTSGGDRDVRVWYVVLFEGALNASMTQIYAGVGDGSCSGVGGSTALNLHCAFLQGLPARIAELTVTKPRAS